jgi:hypothetical protein
MTSTDTVEQFQGMEKLRGLKIGALKNLDNFEDVAQVIYLVHVRGGSEKEPFGDCACVIVHTSGSVGLELRGRLDQFWNYWERRKEFKLSQLSEVADEVAHFFQNEKPAREGSYRFQDGGNNSRVHRAMRSVQLCSELGEIFGYELLGLEG